MLTTCYPKLNAMILATPSLETTTIVATREMVGRWRRCQLLATHDIAGRGAATSSFLPGKTRILRTPFEVVHRGLACAFDPFQDYLFVEGVVIVPPMRGRSSYRRTIFAGKKISCFARDLSRGPKATHGLAGQALPGTAGRPGTI